MPNNVLNDLNSPVCIIDQFLSYVNLHADNLCGFSRTNLQTNRRELKNTYIFSFFTSHSQNFVPDNTHDLLTMSSQNIYTILDSLSSYAENILLITLNKQSHMSSINLCYIAFLKNSRGALWKVLQSQVICSQFS